VGVIGEILTWTWETVFVRWEEADHPFKGQSPFFFSDTRLRDVLKVLEPDPRAALEETVRWLWAHGAEHYPDDSALAVPTERGPEKGPEQNATQMRS
jgi:hypothetical protein